MILSLPTSQGEFFLHYFQGTRDKLFVFIPGLMEPKAGLFYIWKEMAFAFHQRGYSALLFDLAGQGDSLLPHDVALWKEQYRAIYDHFAHYTIHCIARGIGAHILEKGNHVAVYPTHLASEFPSPLPKGYQPAPLPEGLIVYEPLEGGTPLFEKQSEREELRSRIASGFGAQ